MTLWKFEAWFKVQVSDEALFLFQREIHQYFMITFSEILSITPGFGVNNKPLDDKNATFALIWSDRKFSRISTNPCSYAATVLVELVCPEVIPSLPWPDEDFLKYTIERYSFLLLVFTFFVVNMNILVFFHEKSRINNLRLAQCWTYFYKMVLCILLRTIG